MKQIKVADMHETTPVTSERCDCELEENLTLEFAYLVDNFRERYSDVHSTTEDDVNRIKITITITRSSLKE